jgi:hypothetical protein
MNAIVAEAREMVNRAMASSAPLLAGGEQYE